MLGNAEVLVNPNASQTFFVSFITFEVKKQPDSFGYP